MSAEEARNFLSWDSYELVVSEEDQQPVVENNKILLWNKVGEVSEYVKLTDIVRKHFGLVDHDDTESSANCSENMQSKNSEQHADDFSTGDQGKFIWSHQSTLLMLDEYRLRLFRFRDPKTKKKSVWEEIAAVMKARGYLVDADALDRKMRNMKNTFRTICDNNNKKKSTGRGRIQWEYFNYFEDMFQEDKTINLPKSILSSTKIETNKSKMSELFINCGSDSSCASNSNCASSSSNAFLSPSSSTVEQLPLKSPTLLGTPTNSSSSEKSAHISRLNQLRKRQLEVEEEKLQELKKIRKSIEESNKLQNEKLDLLKQLLLPKSDNT